MEMEACCRDKKKKLTGSNQQLLLKVQLQRAACFGGTTRWNTVLPEVTLLFSPRL